MSGVTAPPLSGKGPARLRDADQPTRRSTWPITAAAIAGLILIPVAIFAGAALVLGHPLLSGDNLIQNYPLRVLVGSDLRQGSLPLWDPWIWSGTPLMAGLNAGAFYPATFLYADMSPGGAWVLGQILASSSVAVGTYLFLRATGTGVLPSFLGACSFSFAGAVAAQGAVHMDMAEGFASLPWVLLAVRRMTDDGRWRWSVLLGGSVACLILAGAPEAMLDVTILAITYGVLRVSVMPSTLGRLTTRAAAGFAMGIGLSTFVWLPALHFIATSQRASVTARFAASYSFPPRALVLGLVPFLEGGWGLVSEPQYFGRSNIAEVAFYVGLLPVIAAVALAGRAWSAWLPSRERRTWYVIGLVGIVLAVAAGTPLQHLLFHLPLYGKQRNQGRNIVDVDFAACVLLAWWLDGGSRPRGARATSETVAAAAIPALVVIAVIWLLVAPSSLWSALGAAVPAKAQLGSIRTAAGVSAVLGVAAAAVVILRRRVTRSSWLRLAAVLVVADLGVFVSGTTFASSQAAPPASAPGPLMQMVRANLSPGGRYAVFDPDLFYPSGIVAAGEPDIGILSGLPSVQGYGAIDDGKYAALTATHVRAYLAVGELGIGYFRPLGLQVMVAPAEEFLTPIAALPRSGATANLSPVSEGAGVDPLLPAGTYVPPQASLPAAGLSEPRATLQAGQQAGWFFGTVTSPAQAALVLSRPVTGQVIRVGQVSPAGTISWQPRQHLANSTSTVALDVRALPTAGIVLKLVSGAALGMPRLTILARKRAYVVDGQLASAMTPASWTFVGQADHFGVFLTRYVPEQAWVQALGTYDVASHLRASTRILSQSTDGATIAVTAPRASILLRSSAWEAGWNAEIVSGAAAADLRDAGAGGQLSGESATPVLQVGVLQGVAIPAGLSVVRFSYTALGYSKGLAVAAATVAASAAWFIAVLAFEARKRRASGTSLLEGESHPRGGAA